MSEKLPPLDIADDRDEYRAKEAALIKEMANYSYVILCPFCAKDWPHKRTGLCGKTKPVRKPA